MPYVRTIISRKTGGPRDTGETRDVGPRGPTVSLGVVVAPLVSTLSVEEVPRARQGGRHCRVNQVVPSRDWCPSSCGDTEDLRIAGTGRDLPRGMRIVQKDGFVRGITQRPELTRKCGTFWSKGPLNGLFHTRGPYRLSWDRLRQLRVHEHTKYPHRLVPDVISTPQR